MVVIELLGLQTWNPYSRTKVLNMQVVCAGSIFLRKFGGGLEPVRGKRLAGAQLGDG
jgi:hypothetical protein